MSPGKMLRKRNLMHTLTLKN